MLHNSLHRVKDFVGHEAFELIAFWIDSSEIHSNANPNSMCLNVILFLLSPIHWLPNDARL